MHVAGAAFFALVLLLFPAGLEAQNAASDRIVVAGSVTERVTGEPVAGASLRFRQGDDQAWVGAEVSTNEEGQYATPPLDPGTYELRVQHVAFETFETEIEVAGASPMTVSIELVQDAVELEAIAVTATRNPFLQRSGFYERQRSGLGLVFTREELQARGVYNLTDVFRGIAGTSLDYAGQPTSPLVVFRQGCRPDLVVDGLNYGPGVRMDDLVSASDIEGMEIYRGASTTPGTLSSSECGAVLLWTQSDDFEDAEVFSWTRVAIGVVILGVAQLFRP